MRIGTKYWLYVKSWEPHFSNISSFSCSEPALFVYKNLWTSVFQICLLNCNYLALSRQWHMKRHRSCTWACLGSAISKSKDDAAPAGPCQTLSVAASPRHQTRRGPSPAIGRLHSRCYGQWHKRGGRGEDDGDPTMEPPYRVPGRA
jgi:hypothetical protein